MNKEMIISSNGHETMRGHSRRRSGRRRSSSSASVSAASSATSTRAGSRKSCPACSPPSSTSASSATAFSTSPRSSTPLEEFEKLESGDEDDARRRRGSRRAGAERRGAPRSRSPIDAAAIARQAEPTPQPKIEDLLKEGQEILVQVVKEPLGTKGARLTSHVTMPGRFLVFMPTVDHVGVSRKIESREERARLRGIVREFREAHGFTGGVIIRTAAGGRPKEDIVSDLDALPPDLDRDPPADGIVARAGGRLPRAEPRRASCCAICSPRTSRRSASTTRRSTSACSSWSSGSCRTSLPRVKLYTKPFPIFEEYGVQAEIDKALQEQGVAEVGRLDRHQPDRGAGRDRRQHRPLRRQEDRRAGSRTRSSRPTSRR